MSERRETKRLPAASPMGGSRSIRTGIIHKGYLRLKGLGARATLRADVSVERVA